MLLDGLRGLTAFYVMLGHAVVLLTRGGTGLDLSEGVGGLMSLVLRHGHLAVLVFFLISGFCIHYRQAAVLAAGTSGRLPTVQSFSIFVPSRDEGSNDCCHLWSRP